MVDLIEVKSRMMVIQGPGSWLSDWADVAQRKQNFSKLRISSRIYYTTWPLFLITIYCILEKCYESGC